MRTTMTVPAVIALAALALSGCGSAAEDPPVSTGTSSPLATSATSATPATPATPGSDKVWFGAEAADVAKAFGCGELTEFPDQEAAEERVGATWSTWGICSLEAPGAELPVSVTIYTFNDQQQQDVFAAKLAESTEPTVRGPGAILVIPPQQARYLGDVESAWESAN